MLNQRRRQKARVSGQTPGKGRAGLWGVLRLYWRRRRLENTPQRAYPIKHQVKGGRGGTSQTSLKQLGSYTNKEALI